MINKIKIYVFILLSLICSKLSIGQDCTEFEKHLASINNTYFPGYNEEIMDSAFNVNSAFVNYTIENLLEKPSDKCFISNRKLLRKLKNTFCDSLNVLIVDTLKNGESCRIKLVVGNFEPSKHQIIISDDSIITEKIDGQYPFGGQFGMPEIEIQNIEIEIAGWTLKIPKEAYSDLYYPMMCNNYDFARQIEAYESLNGEYIYLYLYGGEAAGTYFAKLIFDKTNYLSRIISDYSALSIHRSFREGFIGF